jgi:hypothetical protein
MQTIIVYNENEVKEQREILNLKSEDKIWIDLVDPTRREPIPSFFGVTKNFIDSISLKQR